MDNFQDNEEFSYQLQAFLEVHEVLSSQLQNRWKAFLHSLLSRREFRLWCCLLAQARICAGLWELLRKLSHIASPKKEQEIIFNFFEVQRLYLIGRKLKIKTHHIFINGFDFLPCDSNAFSLSGNRDFILVNRRRRNINQRSCIGDEFRQVFIMGAHNKWMVDFWHSYPHESLP